MRRSFWILAFLLALLVAGCAPQPVFTPTATKTPASSLPLPLSQSILTLTETPSPASGPSLTPSNAPASSTPNVSPTPTITTTSTLTVPPPPEADGLPPDHYVMIRPIPTDWTDYGDRTYAYGSTAGGNYRPHTGMEFFNPESTPVVAAANGVVEHSGTDWEVLFGPELAFYGNLIVLRLSDYTYNGQPVYTLYGHLSEMYVQADQSVPVGEIIGAVGGTGVANGGPHLHFEVRVGDPFNYFASTRNPDLWIKPYYGYGTLAGRIVNANGAMLRQVAITVRGADMTRYTWTYAGAENTSDSAWQENFTLGDLPEGWYTVSARSERKTYRAEVYIRSGRTAWLEWVFD